MIRKVSFRLDMSADWKSGLIHGFTQNNAIVEDGETGELHLVPVGPGLLKFECKIDEWVRFQQEAQQRAMSQQVVAIPGGRMTGRG
jgi:hypothetical protein